MGCTHANPRIYRGFDDVNASRQSERAALLEWHRNCKRPFYANNSVSTDHS